MMSIALIKNPSYYLEKASPDRYYTVRSSGEPPGIYMGRGAARLGREGEIHSRQPVKNLFRGLFPDGSRPLVQLQDTKDRKRQPGWDVCLSAPKSLSLAFLLGDDALREGILAAHHRSVDAAFDFASGYCFSRRGRGGTRKEHADPICLRFTHLTSRALDPQIHSHIIFLNACLRKDGTSGTLVSRPLFEQKLAIGAVYRAELAKQMRALGFELRRGEYAWGFELATVPANVVERFSKRRLEIEAAMEKAGSFGPAAAEKAALSTRTTKLRQPLAELLPRWREEARSLGLTRIEVGAPLAPPHQASAPKIVAKAAEKLAAERASWRERDLIVETAKELPLGTGATELRTAVRSGLGGETIEPLKAELYSTKEHVALERELLAIAEASKEDRSLLVSAKRLAKVEKKHYLTPEQSQAFHRVCLEPGGIQLVTGWAGTGKTYCLRAAREAWEAQNLQVVGATVTKAAARELQHATNIETLTVAKLLQLIERQSLRAKLAHHARQLTRAARGKKTWKNDPVPLGKNTVLVIDEAGQASTRDLVTLTSYARARGVRVILSGDSQQTGSILAGGGLAELERVLGSVRLEDIQRQRGWQRGASISIAQGDARTALSLYASHGFVNVASNEAAAKRELVSHWAKLSPSERRETLILAQTRADASDLNRMCQAERKARGELGGLSATLNNERLHVGDRVRITRNDRSLDLANGDHGEIRAILPALAGRSRFIIKIDRRAGGKARYVTLQGNRFPHFALGYAGTIFGVQGSTCRNALVYGDSLDAETGYVALTRHKESCRIFLGAAAAGEDLTELCRAMERSRAKRLAIELAYEPEARRRPGREMQR